MRSIGVLFILICFACSGQKSEEAKLPGDEVTLATVNGETISRYDLENTIYTSYGRMALTQLKEEARKSVLESLVNSRAIAQKRLAEMNPIELSALKKRVQAYQEQLLVKQYLAKHDPPSPVSPEMVKKYYREHPEQFGGRSIRNYEMLTTKRHLVPAERKKLLTHLKKPGRQKDWPKWTAELLKIGLPVQYRKGPLSERVLHPKLVQLSKGLKIGQASPLVFIDGRAYVLRIVDVQGRSPQPYSEVEARIREQLRGKHIKDALQQVSRTALQGVNVVYP
jgi:hypothetical protein